MRLKGSVQAKGVRGFLERPGLILSRFGPTTGPMERRLLTYAALAERFDAGLTIPVPASVLARHPALIRRLIERRVEFAIHGMYHDDHSLLSLDHQRKSLAQAATAFQAAGVPFAGFRGPYLRFNDATDLVLRELGIRYHSSQAVVFETPHAHSNGLISYERAIAYYRARNAEDTAVRPAYRNGLIHIPVALPDDEVMVDRLHCSGEEQAAAWLAVLDATFQRGDLFTIQLHPERIYEAAPALEAVLEEARRRQPRVWLATLEQVAAWWRRRSTFQLVVQALDAGRFRVHLEGDRDAALIVRGVSAPELVQWHGSTTLASRPTLDLASQRKPVVAVSKHASAGVLGFLREEGLATEVSNDSGRFGAYVDVASADWKESDVLAAVERGPGPIVRIGRWPGGARSALAVTGDLDSITLQDFAWRIWETRRDPRP